RQRPAVRSGERLSRDRRLIGATRASAWLPSGQAPGGGQEAVDRVGGHPPAPVSAAGPSRLSRVSRRSAERTSSRLAPHGTTTVLPSTSRPRSSRQHLVSVAAGD